MLSRHKKGKILGYHNLDRLNEKLKSAANFHSGERNPGSRNWTME